MSAQERERQEFVDRYLNGQCDALAIALSSYADAPVRTMHPVHIKKNGERVVTADFLHAYALVEGQSWDAKGRRPEDEVIPDFKRLLYALLKDDDVRMEIEFRDYAGAKEFVEVSGCNPGGAIEALGAAVEPLKLDRSVVRMTVVELAALVDELDESNPAMMFCM